MHIILNYTFLIIIYIVIYVYIRHNYLSIYHFPRDLVFKRENTIGNKNYISPVAFENLLSRAINVA